MKDGPVIAQVASLIGDPARANMLEALMDGRALTAAELAAIAGVTAQTASSHLARLETARLLTARKQGRHRYFALSGTDVAEALEALMGLAQRTGATRVRTGPRDPALRMARICYDHLAGERGIELLEGLKSRGLVAGDAGLGLTPQGRETFTRFGIDLEAIGATRRPLCRACLDWSERRSHLAGALGAALLTAMIDRGWVKREAGRVLTFTRPGLASFRETFGTET
ncbi:ArsR/SmtB family transcription factor [Devosia nitrariae]|uniref:ArsR family transcriptional regulator n=1 Tax=Devosia nitrariae TaxID=2071872 RepID=A0ABQ5W6R7_9HYPH|nr:winged helix-turn-helix domain-containing protein [Devosia nitrariae]GLQ55757.1 ArsR family transcriptional regulator [Devosia nitrariae]